MQDEFKRVLFGANNQERHPEQNVMSVHLLCSGNAEAILQNIREALSVIYSVHLICDSQDEWLTDSVFGFLSDWFVARFQLPEQDHSEQLAYFKYYARDWHWWDARVINQNELTIEIALDGYPVSGFDYLRWLCLCCGCTKVDQGKAVL